MSDFITLSCPSCGAALQVTQDLERFACANCGNEHIVKRIGGTVSLAPVVAQLSRVQAGVDKTAGELAIVRLRREVQSLETQLAAESDPTVAVVVSIVSVMFIVCGIFVGYMFLTANPLHRVWAFLAVALVMPLAGVGGLLFVAKEAREMRTSREALQGAIANKCAELKRNRDLVAQ